MAVRPSKPKHQCSDHGGGPGAHSQALYLMDPYHQVPTHRVTYLEIVSDPDFQAGLSDFFDGRSLPPFNCHWGYERGRLFACSYNRDHPHASPFDLSLKELAAIAARYFLSGEILWCRN